VARNRKRGRDRRTPRPGDVALATARDTDAPPAPLTHATPDAELAEAQLALGRPELASSRPGDDALLDRDDADGPFGPGDEDAGGLGGSGGDFGRGGGAGGSELIPPGGRAPAARENIVLRLANFLRGSWRELQRVQWPDRRQVFQATGVVIGFVIVAGVFLGLADFVASKLVNLILK
jgi:preprotein translocase subunit SecE